MATHEKEAGKCDFRWTEKVSIHYPIITIMNFVVSTPSALLFSNLEVQGSSFDP
jgi:hypothetical protein